MTTPRPDAILAEFERLRDPHPDPELEAVRAALLVEDVFGITVRDQEIDLAVLGDPASLSRLVSQASGSR